MEDLNAQQIVLLTLLVSFVTSIATGITTVSLLEQAPEPVTQTINRVVEKTVERVVEVEGDKPPVEKIVETIVVNAEDLTKEAVANNSSNMVRIYSKNADVKTFATLGIVVSGDGDVIADTRSIVNGVNYVADFPAGERAINLEFKQADSPFALLSVATQEDAPAETFSSAKFANSENIQLAQSVIALSGQVGNVVTTGIVTSLEKDSETGLVNLIDTSVDSSKIDRGAILLNLNGEIIGAKINGDPTRITAFITSNEIKSFLSSLATIAAEESEESGQ
jgi:hypothetical protein